MRQLKLNSQKEWHEWGESGQRPTNIPSKPNLEYRDAGWVNTADWLGYDWKPKLAACGKRRRSEKKGEEEEDEGN